MHAHELATHEVRHARATVAERLREDYGLDLATLDAPETSDETLAQRRSIPRSPSYAARLQHIGNVNLEALAELEELEVRFAHLSEQHRDLSGAKQSLVEIIDRINADSRRLFSETLEGADEFPDLVPQAVRRRTGRYRAGGGDRHAR